MAVSLITGVTGFVGSHLAELLLKKKHKVYGTYRWRSPIDHIRHIKGKIGLLEIDLLDSHALEKAVFSAKPDYIFHLAAQSFVPTSWKAPVHTMQVNAIGFLNLLEAVRKLNKQPMVHIAGSSEEYGFVRPDEVPIKESNPLRPMSPYAVSKVAQDFLGYQYFKSYGMKIVRTRAFNHTGPRRGSVFVCSNWAKQIADIEAGKQEPFIYVGNLRAKRDFSDVRDIVRGYLLLVEKGEMGEVYNLCSGNAFTMQQILDKLLAMSKANIKIKKDQKRMRPSDVEILVGDCSKCKKRTGWQPHIPFEETLHDILEYWRNV